MVPEGGIIYDLMHTKAMQIVYLLFEDIKYRQEDNKFKPLHEIQKLVAEQG